MSDEYKDLKDYFKKVYFEYGVNFDEWYNDDTTSIPDSVENSIFWEMWLNDNNYISHQMYRRAKFTDKFIQEVVDNQMITFEEWWITQFLPKEHKYAAEQAWNKCHQQMEKDVNYRVSEAIKNVRNNS